MGVPISIRLEVVSHVVATTAKARLRAMPSRVTPEQLAAIRRQIALAVGVEIS